MISNSVTVSLNYSDVYLCHDSMKQKRILLKKNSRISKAEDIRGLQGSMVCGRKGGGIGGGMGGGKREVCGEGEWREVWGEYREVWRGRE